MIFINKNSLRKKKIFNIKEKFNTSTYYFINSLIHSFIKDGKKFKILIFFFKIFGLLKKKFKINNLFLFFYFVQQRLHSKIYLKQQHIGIIPYLIPVISIRKSIFLAKSWILKAIKERRERSFILRLFSELSDLKLGKGLSLLKRFEYYKIIKDSWSNFRFLKYVNIKINYYYVTKQDFNLLKKLKKRKKIKIKIFNKIIFLKNNYIKKNNLKW